METIEDEERKQAEALKILKPSEKQKTNSSEDIFPKHQGSHEIKKELNQKSRRTNWQKIFDFQ